MTALTTSDQRHPEYRPSCWLCGDRGEVVDWRETRLCGWTIYVDCVCRPPQRRLVRRLRGES